MTTREKKTAKRNQADATLRNVRASSKRTRKLAKRQDKLHALVKALRKEMRALAKLVGSAVPKSHK